MRPTWKQIILWAYPRGADPGSQRLPGVLSDLELHRALGLLLHNYRARSDDISTTYIPHAQPHQITRSQLAVDGEIEECKLTGAVPDLQSYPDRPDVLQS